MTLGEFLNRWVEDSIKDSVKPITYENYSMLTRHHLIPALGRNKIKALTSDHIRRFRSTKLNAELSTRTVQLLLTLLRKALQQAVNDGLVPRNVAQNVKVHQIRKDEVRRLDAEQAKRLLSSAQGDRLEALYVLGIHTGLRQSELLGLKWKDVDFEVRTLSVKRTLSSAKNGPRFTTPKTKKSRRSVYLTAEAIEALQRHRAMQNEEKSMVGGSWGNRIWCSAPRRAPRSNATTSSPAPSSPCSIKPVSPAPFDSTTSGTRQQASCSRRAPTPK